MSMSTQVIDLRSDTVTRPSPAMREAMASAAVGDDVYGDDPTVRALEQRVCEISGLEAALFVPSGSQANLIAQMIHCRRGDEVLLGARSHAVMWEVGAGAAIAGVQYDVVPGSGLITAEDVRERLTSATFHNPGTGLVWLENTHNMGGGRVLPQSDLAAISDLCRERRIPLHMDGARVFNAAVALGVPLAAITSHVDSFSFCLSKGLGAPVGSVLAGTATFRREALRLRKMLGGGMRQAGILAAAGLFALERNVERLAEDHASALRLAEALSGMPGLDVDLRAVETNIVLAHFTPRHEESAAGELARACARRGVLFQEAGWPRAIRFVTHLDVSPEQITATLPVVREELARLRR